MKKTIIITGSTGNLGKAVTTTFLDKGYTIIATITNAAAVKDFPRHEQLQAELVDLTNEDVTATFIERAIDRHEKIDAALMLVGGFAMGKIAETTGSDIRKQMAINFETAYYVARPLLKHMISKNYGRLIFIGSRPALQSSDGKNMIAYALSKSLLFKLAECINEEVKGKNIVATVVVPSTIDTPQNRKSMPATDPGKWIKPTELAEILEFICSDTASPLRETVLKVYNNS